MHITLRAHPYVHVLTRDHVYDAHVICARSPRARTPENTYTLLRVHVRARPGQGESLKLKTCTCVPEPPVHVGDFSSTCTQAPVHASSRPTSWLPGQELKTHELITVLREKTTISTSNNDAFHCQNKCKPLPKQLPQTWATVKPLHAPAGFSLGGGPSAWEATFRNFLPGT